MADDSLERLKAKRLALIGSLTALVALGTMFLKIPGPTGYYHLGDGILYVTAVMLGLARARSQRRWGPLADLAGGFPVWAPWTFAIKGAAGYLVGLIARQEGFPRRLIAMALGSAVTIAGYAVATAVMYGYAAAWVEVYGNIAQTMTGIAVATAFLSLCGRSRGPMTR